MPSIPAIQQKTIEDKAYSDFIENITILDDDIKLPNLYAIILFLYLFRYQRMEFLADISYHIGRWGLTIDFPILFLRAFWLFGSLEVWAKFWTKISDALGMNWEFPYY